MRGGAAQRLSRRVQLAGGARCAQESRHCSRRFSAGSSLDDQSALHRTFSSERRQKYVDRIVQSAKPRPASTRYWGPGGCREELAVIAPFLEGIEQWAEELHVHYVPAAGTAAADPSAPRGPDHGYLEVSFPISTHGPLRNAWVDLEHGGATWNPIRLGKFFEVAALHLPIQQSALSSLPDRTLDGLSLLAARCCAQPMATDMPGPSAAERRSWIICRLTRPSGTPAESTSPGPSFAWCAAAPLRGHSRTYLRRTVEHVRATDQCRRRRPRCPGDGRALRRDEACSV